MEFVARKIDIGTNTPTVLLNGADAEELGAHPLDRVQIQADGRTTIGIVEVTEQLVEAGELGLTSHLAHIDGTVDVTLAPKPASVAFIRKKLNDVELDREEIRRIVYDVDQNRLNDVELSAYVCAAYANGLSLEETMHLTECMTDIGEVITWDDDVIADKHSIGGVAGNRVTPIIVPIVAASGVKIPKTSSRAVTSPAGTADTMEVFCDVEFSLESVADIVERTNGCVVWGGSVNLSPVDDKIIRAETPLSIDPAGQVIASVLSKKESAGSTHVVIDIPYGEGSKVGDLTEARELAQDFKRVGDHVGLTVECTITHGSQPIGRGIGPVLEARDILGVLGGGGPRELRQKSIRLADIILEVCGVEADATDVLDSGRAIEQFREIVAAQNGDPDVTADDLTPGRETRTIRADHAGVVTSVNNRAVSEVARRAGAPKDHGAGVYLHRRLGDDVGEDDPLFTIHAEKRAKLSEATSVAEGSTVFRVGSPDEALVERL